MRRTLTGDCVGQPFLTLMIKHPRYPNGPPPPMCGVISVYARPKDGKPVDPTVYPYSVSPFLSSLGGSVSIQLPPGSNIRPSARAPPPPPVMACMGVSLGEIVSLQCAPPPYPPPDIIVQQESANTRVMGVLY